MGPHLGLDTSRTPKASFDKHLKMSMFASPLQTDGPDVEDPIQAPFTMSQMIIPQRQHSVDVQDNNWPLLGTDLQPQYRNKVHLENMTSDYLTATSKPYSVVQLWAVQVTLCRWTG